MKVFNGQLDITKMLKYKNLIKEVEFKDGLHKLLDIVLVFKDQSFENPGNNAKFSSVGFLSCCTRKDKDDRYTSESIIANFTKFRRKNEETEIEK